MLDVLRTAAMTGRPYTVAVVDRTMPDIDGLKLAAKIKADPTIRNVQLIILTSLEDELPRRRGDAARTDLPAEAGAAVVVVRHVLDARPSQALARAIAGTTRRPTQDATPVPSLIGDTRRLQVLVADDNEINQLVAVEMLRTAGYDATVVNNGLEAVSAIRRGKFDVVLMDCEMPELDGFAATRMIRTMESEQSLAAPNGRPLPIIALTAQAVQGDRERCLSAGMTDYVTKPVNREELLQDDSGVPRRGCGAPAACRRNCRRSDSCHGGSELPDADEAVLDIDELQERCMGDRPFIDELLKIFVKKARSNVTRISESIAAGRGRRRGSRGPRTEGLGRQRRGRAIEPGGGRAGNGRRSTRSDIRLHRARRARDPRAGQLRTDDRIVAAGRATPDRLGLRTDLMTRILVVDDDEIGLAVVRNALAHAGHEVLTATNGEEALAVLRREDVRLVITDWEMPVLDGLDLCRAIRRRDGGYVYVILLTSHGSSAAIVDRHVGRGGRFHRQAVQPGRADGAGAGRRAGARRSRRARW